MGGGVSDMTLGVGVGVDDLSIEGCAEAGLLLWGELW